MSTDNRQEKAQCGHRDCAGLECPKCGTSPCCWHLDTCDHYRTCVRSFQKPATR